MYRFIVSLSVPTYRNGTLLIQRIAAFSLLILTAMSIKNFVHKLEHYKSEKGTRSHRRKHRLVWTGAQRDQTNRRQQQIEERRVRTPERGPWEAKRGIEIERKIWTECRAIRAPLINREIRSPVIYFVCTVLNNCNVFVYSIQFPPNAGANDAQLCVAPIGDRTQMCCAAAGDRLLRAAIAIGWGAVLPAAYFLLWLPVLSCEIPN